MNKNENNETINVDTTLNALKSLKSELNNNKDAQISTFKAKKEKELKEAPKSLKEAIDKNKRYYFENSIKFDLKGLAVLPLDLQKCIGSILSNVTYIENNELDASLTDSQNLELLTIKKAVIALSESLPTNRRVGSSSKVVTFNIEAKDTLEKLNSIKNEKDRLRAKELLIAQFNASLLELNK